MASEMRSRIWSSDIPARPLVWPAAPLMATESWPLESPRPPSDGSPWPPVVSAATGFALASLRPESPVMLSDCVPRPSADAIAAAVESPAADFFSTRDASSSANVAVWSAASAVIRTSFVTDVKAASSALTT